MSAIMPVPNWDEVAEGVLRVISDHPAVQFCIHEMDHHEYRELKRLVSETLREFS